MLISDDGDQPLCLGESDLFFGTEEDGREEVGRADREALCKVICFDCPLRRPCLEEAMVNGERYGVWGGMGEGERKKFRRHLTLEGYDHGEVPAGLELWAAERAFRRAQRRERTMEGDRLQSA